MFHRETFIGIIKEMRPSQWYKQSLLFIPVIVTSSFFDIYSWFYCFLGAVSFSLVCSSVYIFNDINDIEEDRSHPVKKNRPIASGQISIPTGLASAILLAILGLSLSLYLNTIFFSLILLYLLQNILYSIKLKDIIIIDLIIVAFGMVIRAISSFILVEKNIRWWLILIVFMTGFLLVVGKRKREIEEFSTERVSLSKYNLKELDNLFNFSQASVFIIYIIYIYNSKNKLLIFTTIFAIYAIVRHNHLVVNQLIDDEPKKLLSDYPFLINLLLWLCSILAIVQFQNII